MKEKKEMGLANTGLGRLSGSLQAAAQTISRNKLAKRITAGMLAMSMIATTALTNVGITAWATPTSAGLEKVVDGQTPTPGDMITDANANGGKVWTDKSVYERLTELDGKTLETVKPGDNGFVEVFSALGSGTTNEKTTPIDISLILDITSSELNGTYEGNLETDTSNLAKVLNAANQLMSQVKSYDADSRISVTVFWGTGKEIISFDDTASGTPQFTKYVNYNDGGGMGEAELWWKLNENAAEESYRGYASDRDRNDNLGGGTNYQGGIVTGMGALANRTSDQTDGRVPVVVLLGDGQANHILSGSEDDWWYGNVCNTSMAVGEGADGIQDAIAVLSATYYKALIAKAYNRDKSGVYVYTILAGSGEGRSLNPNGQYDGYANNSHAYTCNAGGYTKGPYSDTSTGTLTLAAFPESAINGVTRSDLEDCDYPTKYYSYDKDGKDLAAIFNNIFEDIKTRIPATPPVVDTPSKLTYTDPIGEFMTVKTIDYVIMHNQLCTVTENKSSAKWEKINEQWYMVREFTVDNPGTDVINPAYVQNADGGKVKLEDFTIELKVPVTGENLRTPVSGNDIHETMIVEVPRGALPIQVKNKVTGELTNDPDPLRVVYTVEPVNGLITAEGGINFNMVGEDYYRTHQTNGSVFFYTNYYDPEHPTEGEAKVTFKPADDNSYYSTERNTTTSKQPHNTDTTGTASHQSGDTSGVTDTQGNNGKLTVPFGQLEVEKVVENASTSNTEDKFKFYMILKKDSEYLHGAISYKQGSQSGSLTSNRSGSEGAYVYTYVFELKAGESIVFNGLPAGVTYEISEVGDNFNNQETYRITGITGADSQVITDGKASGTISSNGTKVTVTYTNQELVALPISKKITTVGTTEADPNKVFTFNVKVTGQPAGTVKAENVFDANGNSTTDEVTFDENGETTVYLKHNQTTTIKGLIPGATYTITEVTPGAPYKIDGDGVANAPVTGTLPLNEDAPDIAVKDTTVVNHFSPTVTASLKGRKLLDDSIIGESGDDTGKLLEDEHGNLIEFTFILKPTTGPNGENNPFTDPLVNGVTVHNDKNGNITFFTDEVYYEPGDYYYSIKEKVDSPNKGMKYDDSEYTVKVSITQNKDGDYTFNEPEISIVNSDGTSVGDVEFEIVPTFQNSYSPDEVNVRIDGHKELEGATLPAGEFEFTIEPMGYRLATDSNGQRDLHEANVPTQAVEDSQPSSEPETSSTEETTAGETESQPSSKETVPVATPSEPEWKLPLPAEQIPIRPVPAPQDLSTQPMPWDGIYTVTNDVSGDYAFASIYYTEEGIYNYRVTETKGENANIDYDTTVYDVVVTVTRKHDADRGYYLQASWEAFKVSDIDEDGNGNRGASVGQEVDFKNTYNPPPFDVKKEQSNEEGTTDDLLIVEDGNIITYTMTVTNTVEDTDGEGSRGALLDVVVYDTVPEGLILVDGSYEDCIQGIEGATADFDWETRMIKWYRPSLGANESWKVSFQVEVPEVTEDKVYRNTAFAYSGTPDDDTPDLQTDTVVLIEGVPDIDIAKSQTVTSDGQTSDRTDQELIVKEGDEVTYYLTVVNNGTERAAGVTVTDEVPYVTDEDGRRIPLELAGYSEDIADVTVETDPETGAETITWVLREDLAGREYVEEYSHTETIHDAKGREVEVTYKTKVPAAGSKGGEATVSYTVKVPDVKENTRWTNIAAVTDDEEPDPKHSNEVAVLSGKPNVWIEKSQKLGDGEATKERLTADADNIVTYYLTVHSDGTEDATGIKVRDAIPEGLQLVDIQNGGILDEASNTIEWNIGTLKGKGFIEESTTEVIFDEENNTYHEKTTVVHREDPDGVGESATVSFRVKTPEVSEDTVWKNVAVTTYENNPDNPDDPDDPPAEIPSNEVLIDEYPPSLYIEKFQSKNGGEKTKNTLPVDIGDEVTYYLAVTNSGKSTAKDVYIEDTIPYEPDQLILVDSKDGQKITDADGHQALRWHFDELKVGETEEVSFVVRVPEGSTSNRTWTNIGTTYYKNNPDNPKPDDPGYDPDDPYAEIPSNPVVIQEGAPQINIVKTQSVNGGAFTTDLLDVNEGSVVTYRLAVSNTGSSTALDVVVTDEVPEGLTLVQNSISGSGTADGRKITWHLGNMAPGETEVVTFQVTVPAVSAKTVWTNVATTNYGNNPDNPDDPDEPREEIPSNEVKVQEDTSDVKIVKDQSVNGGTRTTEKLQVEPGDEVTYYITVSHDGGSWLNTKEVFITDQIPGGTPGLTLKEGSISDGGVLQADGKTIKWSLGRLRSGQSKTVSFTVTVPQVKANTAWENVAMLYGDDPDDPKDPENPPTPEESNKVVVEEKIPGINTYKEQSVDNGATYTRERLRVYGGDVVTYRITVYNNGEETAKDVTVKDAVPDGLTLVEGSISAGGSLGADGKTITWNLGNVAAGATMSVSFQVWVPTVGNTTTWKNIASTGYSNNPENPKPGDPGYDPENPNKEIPTNEVEITEEPLPPSPGRTPGGNPGGNPGTEIPDNPTPLAEFPDGQVPLSGFETIQDEDVPLAFLAPTTGDNKPVGAAALFGLVALGMMGAFGILGFKKKDEEEA